MGNTCCCVIPRDIRVTLFTGKHYELKQKFKMGEPVDQTIKDIEKLIMKHEQELRKFAGL